MYSVTSDFQVSAAAKNAVWKRQLLIGSSDYTDDVLKWPTISKKWDGVNPQTVTIDLANEGKLFNFLMTDPTKMHSTTSLKLGFHNQQAYSEDLAQASAWTMHNLSVGSSGITIAGFPTKRLTLSGGSTNHYFSGHTTISGRDVAKSFAIDVTGINSKSVYVELGQHAVNFTWDGPRTISVNQLGGVGHYEIIDDYQAILYASAVANNVTYGAVYPCQTAAFSGDGQYVDVTRAMYEDNTTKHNTYNKTGATADELLTMYSGTIDSARYSGGTCKLTLIDKFRKLADRKVGDSTVPVAYTASSYLVHDMGWYACTSLGGLSAITSTNNPDIDYQSWSLWSSVFSTDNVRVQAQLTGQTPLEMLRKLSLLTQSAIYVENDKIKFGRFTIAGSAYITLDNSKVVDAEATLNDQQLLNKQYVSAAYDTTSKSFGITVLDASTYSVNRYGVRENLIAESFLWLTDSVSALNLAQRMVRTGRDIQSRYSIKAPLHSVLSTIGDVVLFQDALLDVSDTYRIMEETVDMDSGLKTFGVDQTQYFGAFTLDVSELDGADVLT